MESILLVFIGEVLCFLFELQIDLKDVHFYFNFLNRILDGIDPALALKVKLGLMKFTVPIPPVKSKMKRKKNKPKVVSELFSPPQNGDSMDINVIQRTDNQNPSFGFEKEQSQDFPGVDLLSQDEELARIRNESNAIDEELKVLTYSEDEQKAAVKIAKFILAKLPVRSRVEENVDLKKLSSSSSFSIASSVSDDPPSLDLQMDSEAEVEESSLSVNFEPIDSTFNESLTRSDHSAHSVDRMDFYDNVPQLRLETMEIPTDFSHNNTLSPPLPPTHKIPSPNKNLGIAVTGLEERQQDIKSSSSERKKTPLILSGNGSPARIVSSEGNRTSENKRKVVDFNDSIHDDNRSSDRSSDDSRDTNEDYDSDSDEQKQGLFDRALTSAYSRSIYLEEGLSLHSRASEESADESSAGDYHLRAKAKAIVASVKTMRDEIRQNFVAVVHKSIVDKQSTINAHFLKIIEKSDSREERRQDKLVQLSALKKTYLESDAVKRRKSLDLISQTTDTFHQHFSPKDDSDSHTERLHFSAGDALLDKYRKEISEAAFESRLQRPIDSSSEGKKHTPGFVFIGGGQVDENGFYRPKCPAVYLRNKGVAGRGRLRNVGGMKGQNGASDSESSNSDSTASSSGSSSCVVSEGSGSPKFRVRNGKRQKKKVNAKQRNATLNLRDYLLLGHSVLKNVSQNQSNIPSKRFDKNLFDSEVPESFGAGKSFFDESKRLLHELKIARILLDGRLLDASKNVSEAEKKHSVSTNDHVKVKTTAISPISGRLWGPMLCDVPDENTTSKSNSDSVDNVLIANNHEDIIGREIQNVLLSSHSDLPLEETPEKGNVLTALSGSISAGSTTDFIPKVPTPPNPANVSKQSPKHVKTVNSSIAGNVLPSQNKPLCIISRSYQPSTSNVSVMKAKGNRRIPSVDVKSRKRHLPPRAGPTSLMTKKESVEEERQRSSRVSPMKSSIAIPSDSFLIGTKILMSMKTILPILWWIPRYRKNSQIPLTSTL